MDRGLKKTLRAKVLTLKVLCDVFTVLDFLLICLYVPVGLSGYLAVWLSGCLVVCIHQALMTKWPYSSWSAMSGHGSGSG
jgi:hypothetical protein